MEEIPFNITCFVIGNQSMTLINEFVYIFRIESLSEVFH